MTRTYSYDNAGNTTGYSGLTFTYSDAGRMTGVSGGASATYAHNALGQRVKKVTGGNTTYFVYDEAGHLIGEYTSAGNLIQETVWLDDIPVVTLRPDGSGGVNVFYVHTDHLNTPRRVSRPSDNVVLWRWDSDPFGTTAANPDPDGDSTNFAYNLRFPGQYYDAETGLNYNYFRDYDSQTGRYVQSDPIGLDGGINTYSYAGSNPVSFADPTGESPMAIPAAEWCLSNPACAVPAGAATGVALTCLINPDLCKSAATLACEDVSQMAEDTAASIVNWLESRRHWDPTKENRKKQGREAGEKKRQSDSWKPRNPPREPPKHTPSRKK